VCWLQRVCVSEGLSRYGITVSYHVWTNDDDNERASGPHLISNVLIDALTDFIFDFNGPRHAKGLGATLIGLSTTIHYPF
jgi:hypothetical protein